MQQVQPPISPGSLANWDRSDQYHNSFLIPKDDVLDAVVRKNTEQGLPNIAVSKAQGKLLSLVAKSIGAKRILEVGTLGGQVLLRHYGAGTADVSNQVFHNLACTSVTS